VLWIVGITNAVNLIDGLDGLAAGIALITTITLATIALAREQQSMGVAAISIVLAGSLIGFLRFNFNPARIFLGDSGSMFLGFVLAVISVRGSQKGATAVAVFVPLLVLGLPLLDTGLAVLRRLYRLGNHGGRTQNRLTYMLRNLNYVFLPDRGHIHHRLLDLGLGQRGAVMVLYGAALLLALAGYALTFKKNGIELALLLGGVLVVSMATFLALLYFRVWRVKNGGRSEITEERDPSSSPCRSSRRRPSRGLPRAFPPAAGFSRPPPSSASATTPTCSVAHRSRTTSSPIFRNAPHWVWWPPCPCATAPLSWTT
jgi:hypothetical protein